MTPATCSPGPSRGLLLRPRHVPHPWGPIAASRSTPRCASPATTGPYWNGCCRRVCLQPGSAVVASFRRRHPLATCPSLHPGPGKPPLTLTRPPPRWRPRPRPSPSVPSGMPRGAFHAPLGDATVVPASAARAVELPIPQTTVPQLSGIGNRPSVLLGTVDITTLDE
jgi:hypothetical protein